MIAEPKRSSWRRVVGQSQISRANRLEPATEMQIVREKGNKPTLYRGLCCAI
jgi:hypothetical protein